MLRPIPDRVIDRVMTRYTVEGDCWISDYSRGKHGYAQVGWRQDERNFMTLAHRVSWVARHGDIPDDMTIDHMCFTRPCINPDHLRLLTRSENSGIHAGPWMPRNYQPPRTSPPVGRPCFRGHELVADRNGRTYCRECRVLRKRARKDLSAA